MTSAAASQAHAVASLRNRRTTSGGLPLASRRTGDTFLCVLLLVYLVSLVFEGPLRYALLSTGLPNAIYIRDAIPVGTLAFLFLRSLFVDETIEPLIAIPAALLLFHGALAAMLGVPFFSILFGFKIFMFVPYGMAMWPLIRPRLDAALTVAAIMLFVTLCGLLLNVMLERMPWEGLEYDTAFGAVKVTRLWWMSPDLARLPGFARSSFDAAMILGITATLTMIRLRTFLLRAAVAAVTFAALLPTTSKGMILVFPLAAIWLLIGEGRTQTLTGRAMVYVLCTVAVVLPFMVVFFDVGYGISATSVPGLFDSVWERFTRMWPQAFDLLPSGPAALLGAGLGSIGTPQLFGDAPHRFNAADSIALYMTINFGVLGLLYCIAPAFGLSRVSRLHDQLTYRAYTGVLLIAYGYGISIPMFEENFFSIFFGICFGVLATTVFTSKNSD